MPFSSSYRKRLLILLFTGSFIHLPAFAQNPFTTLIHDTESDGNKILQAFTDPFLKRHGDGWSDG